MISIKTQKEIESLRIGGQRLAQILKQVSLAVKPGVSSSELNDLAHKLMIEGGDKPAFLHYKTAGAKPYPASLCVSINDEIVHGIPNYEDKIIKEGDIVSLDAGLVHDGLITDSAVSVIAGDGDALARKLVNATKEALSLAIKSARGGACVGDIGFAVSEVAKRNGFSVAEDLAGHGVGYKVHEDPFIPNYGKRGEGILLKAGMVIAIEPMFNEGSGRITATDDGWTYKTRDGKRSAHFEHTIAITDGDPVILTKD